MAVVGRYKRMTVREAFWVASAWSEPANPLADYHQADGREPEGFCISRSWTFQDRGGVGPPHPLTCKNL